MKNRAHFSFLFVVLTAFGVGCSDDGVKVADPSSNNQTTGFTNNQTTGSTNNQTTGQTNGSTAGVACAAEEAALREGLDSATTDTDFALLLRCAAGGEFVHSVGDSSASKTYESASTSKWVTAVTILRLVDKGVLNLSDNPQKYLSFWTSDAASPLSKITLGQLLSFTSGLEVDAPCTSLPGRPFEACVEIIYNNNLASPVEPGTGFFYTNTHLQVAGLMAIKASGKASWGEVFEGFQAETGLFPNGIYDLPSEQNPRLAGGMHWRGDEYLDFLEAFYSGELLSESLQRQVLQDHTVGVEIRKSPALENIGQDWHYGFGFWLECASATYDCSGISRVSSPGAYGAYPYIDYTTSCVGMLARQGDLASYPEGKKLLDSVQPQIDAWTACTSGM